jgi:hypothetical protein
MSNTILLPSDSQATASGPVEFAQSNVTRLANGRQPANDNFIGSVGLPEADLQKQLGRWNFCDTFQWNAVTAPGTLLYTLDTPTMLAKAKAFGDVIKYYRLNRVTPVIRVIISGHASQVGQLQVAFLPRGVNESEYALNWPSIYPWNVLRPHEQASVEVKGAYVNQFRASDTIQPEPINYGLFHIHIINQLRCLASSPQAVSVVVYVKFENETVRGFIPPPLPTISHVWETMSQDDKDQLKALIMKQVKPQTEQPAQQKALTQDDINKLPRLNADKQSGEALSTAANIGKGVSTMYKAGRRFAAWAGFKPAQEKGGVMDGIGDVLDVVGSVAKFATSVIPLGAMLLHSPSRPYNSELAVCAKPQAVTRLQYDAEQICAPDGTISQIPNFMLQMDMLSLMRQKCRVTSFEWNDTHMPGVELFNIVAHPSQHTLWAPLYFRRMIPAFWRGTIDFHFQFVKNVFHKGTVSFQIIPVTSAPTLSNSTQGLTQVFEISKEDTYTISVPWMYAPDFIETQDGTEHILYKVSVLVQCALQTAQTVSQIDVNCWMELGNDFQFLGGPSQKNFNQTLTGIPTTVATQKGLEEAVLPTTTVGKPDETKQQSEGTPTESGQHAGDFIPTNLNETEPSQPVGQKTPETDAAWYPKNQSNLKLSSHRIHYIGAETSTQIPLPLIFGPIVPNATGRTLIFSACQEDLLRSLPESQFFAYVSGGIRLTWNILGNMLTGGSIYVCTLFQSNPETTVPLSASMQQFQLPMHLQHTVEIPYMQNVAMITRDVNYSEESVSHWIYIYYLGDTVNITHAPYFTIGVHASDDFNGQQPVYWSGVDAPVLKHPIRILGVPTAEMSKHLDFTDARISYAENTAFDGPILKDTEPAQQKGFSDDEDEYPSVVQNQEHVQTKPPSYAEALKYTPTEPVYKGCQKWCTGQIICGDLCGYRYHIQRCMQKEAAARRKEQDFRTQTFGLKIKKNTERVKPLNHCDTRRKVQGRRNAQPRDEFTEYLKDPVNVEKIGEGLDECYHVHTPRVCYKQKTDGHITPLHAVAWGAMAAEIETAYHTKLVPYKMMSKGLWKHRVRLWRDKNSHCFHYMTRVGDRLFETRTEQKEEVDTVWGALHEQEKNRTPAQQKGMWDWFTKVKDNHIKEAAGTFVDQCAAEVRKRIVGEALNVDFGAVAIAFSAKIAAYATQIFSANSILSWVSIILHLFGDLQLAFKGWNLISALVKAVTENAPEFVRCLWKNPVVAEPKDDQQSEIDHEGLFSVFRRVGEAVFQVVIDGKDAFWTTIKSMALVGAGVRGVQAVITGIKSLLEWLGLVTSEAQKKLSDAQAFVSRPEVMKAFDYMIVCLTASPHRFNKGMIPKIKETREIARIFMELTAGIKNPKLDTYKDRVVRFLKHTISAATIEQGDICFEPVFVFLDGMPGLGKSLFANFLARTLSTAFKRDQNDFYPCILEQDYFTGYTDQPVILMDDLFQDPLGQGVSFLTQLISSVPTPMNQADIESKMTLSSARIIIATSNTTTIKGEWITDPNAIRRRFKDTHFTAVEKDVFVKNTWDYSRTKHTWEQTQSSERLTENQVIDRIVEVYKTKYERHLQLLAKPIRQIEFEDKLAAPASNRDALGFNEKTVVLTPTDPLVMKVDLNKKIGDLSHLDFSMELQDALAAMKDTVEEKKPVDTTLHNLQLPCYNPIMTTALTLELLTSYDLPIITWTTGAENKMQFDMSDVELKRLLSHYDENKIHAVCVWLKAQKIPEEMIFSILPYRNKLSALMSKMNINAAKGKAWFIGVGVLTGVLGTAYLTYKLLQPGYASEKGTYSPQGRAKQQSRVHYEGAPPSIATPKGLDEKQPIIDKALCKWSCHWDRANPSKTIKVNALRLGGGFVLTVAHAVMLGAQHIISVPIGEGQLMDIPVMVTTQNCYTMLVNGNPSDMAVVNLGACIPNTRDLLNYFAEDEVVNHLSEGPARLIYKTAGENLVTVDTQQKFVSAYPVEAKQTRLIYHVDGFKVPIKVPHGACGSPLLTSEPSKDARILGIVAAGRDFDTIVVPVTKNMLILAKQTLLNRPYIVDQPPQEGILEMAQFKSIDDFQNARVETAEALNINTVEIATQPVHTPVESVPGGLVSANIQCSYRNSHAWASYKVIDKIDSPDGQPVEFEPTRLPAMRYRNRTKNPFPKIEGHAEITLPGDQFGVERQPMYVDEIVLEMAMTAFLTKAQPEIAPCRILTDREVIQGYEHYGAQGQLVVNQGLPTNTAIGQTSKSLGLGTRKGDAIEPDKQSFTPDFEKVLTEIEQMLMNGETWQRVIALNLKDELRNAEKLRDGKIRLFCVEDMIFVVLMGKYFGQFIDQYRSCNLNLWHTLGTDPVQIWNKLAAWIGDYVLAGDGKNWDMSLQGMHFEIIRRVIEPFYAKYSQPDIIYQKEAVVRQTLLQHVAYSITGYHGHNFVSTGMKSGIYATTEFNTLIQTIIILYSGALPMASLERPLEIVNELRTMKFVSNGDDNLIGRFSPRLSKDQGWLKTIHPEMRIKQTVPMTSEEQRNGVVQAYQDFGIVLTGSKKTNDLEWAFLDEIEYLRRTFWASPHLGKYMPRISEDTIIGLLAFHKKSTTDVDNIMEALTFARQGRNLKWFKIAWLMLAMAYPDTDFDTFSWNAISDRYNRPDWDTNRIDHSENMDASTALCCFSKVHHKIFHILERAPFAVSVDEAVSLGFVSFFKATNPSLCCSRGVFHHLDQIEDGPAIESLPQYQAVWVTKMQFQLNRKALETGTSIAHFSVERFAACADMADNLVFNNVAQFITALYTLKEISQNYLIHYLNRLWPNNPLVYFFIKILDRGSDYVYAAMKASRQDWLNPVDMEIYNALAKQIESGVDIEDLFIPVEHRARIADNHVANPEDFWHVDVNLDLEEQADLDEADIDEVDLPQPDMDIRAFEDVLNGVRVEVHPPIVHVHPPVFRHMDLHGMFHPDWEGEPDERAIPENFDQDIEGEPPDDW